jgi:pimeloyl-ACP methyl ester carboxylesterase
MAICELGAARIAYDLEGAGFPVLLIAPGGMSSENEIWNGFPWNPRTALTDDYQVIGMDQRNAGRSTGPVAAGDGWSTFTEDQLGLLDSLGIERCHVVGSCIGGSYILSLLSSAPDRFLSAVMLQPIGIDENRSLFQEAYAGWAERLAPDHPEATADDWRALGEALWDPDHDGKRRLPPRGHLTGAGEPDAERAARRAVEGARVPRRRRRDDQGLSGRAHARLRSDGQGAPGSGVELGSRGSRGPNSCHPDLAGRPWHGHSPSQSANSRAQEPTELCGSSARRSPSSNIAMIWSLETTLATKPSIISSAVVCSLDDSVAVQSEASNPR